MSSINNSLIIAGALGMAGSGLIEVARSFESAIGVPLSPFLPTQENNAMALCASTALFSSGVARKVFCGQKAAIKEEIKNYSITTHATMDTEETSLTSDLLKRIEVAGRSRAGKSLWIETLFGGLQTCGSPTIFRGTENATLYEKLVGLTRWVIKDTPGLFESSGEGQVARDNKVILEQIRSNPDEVIDAVIYTLPEVITGNDIKSLIAVHDATPKTAKTFLLLTQCEKCGEEVSDIKRDRLNQLMEGSNKIPQELLEKLRTCPIILSGAINVQETGSTTRQILDQVDRIFKYNEDARETLVGGLIESSQTAEKCLEKLAEPFQLQQEGVLESIAEYITAQAGSIDLLVPKITEKAKEIGLIEKELEANPVKYDVIPGLRARLTEIATALNAIATEFPMKAEDLCTIAKNLCNNKDPVSTIKELKSKSEEIDSLLGKLGENSRDLDTVWRDFRDNAKFLDDSKLKQANTDLAAIVDANIFLGDFSFTRDEDLINKLGYLAIAVKIQMKQFVPNKPKWDVHPGMESKSFSVVNCNF